MIHYLERLMRRIVKNSAHYVEEDIRKLVHRSITNAHRQITRYLFLLMFSVIGFIALLLAFFFFMIDYLAIDKTLALVIVGVIFLLMAFIVKLNN